MAYFYVKNSLGTCADGTGALAKQTGAFGSGLLVAANVYATIQIAIDSGGATSGDFICVSDAHNFTTTSNITYNGPYDPDFLQVVSVSDSNAGEYTKAATAQESTTAAGRDLVLLGRISFLGIFLKVNDVMWFQVSTQVIIDSSVIEFVDSAAKFYSANDGNYIKVVNSVIDYTANSGFFEVRNAGSVEFEDTTISGIPSLFTNLTGDGGGTYGKFTGCDLSGVTSSLMATGGNSADADDIITIIYKACKLNATEPTFVSAPELMDLNHKFLMTNCSGSSSDAEYRYYYETRGGSVEQHDTIYRDNSTPFPGGAKVSLQSATLSSATTASPFCFEFPTRYAELSNIASDTLRIYLQSSTQLYDSDVWAEVTYADATNHQESNYLSTRHDNILDTNGTELATSAESWSGTAQTYQYQIDIDTSADPGTDCAATIHVHVAKAANIYFCTDVDQVG